MRGQVADVTGLIRLMEMLEDLLKGEPTPRQIARDIVAEYGWWTLQWPIVKRNFSTTTRWVANGTVFWALLAGIVKAVKRVT